MKKATEKTAPASLGTKRNCPKCATKFYDFNKEEIVCPKCATKVDPEALDPFVKLPQETKKPAKTEKEGDEVVVEEGEVLESVDDLGDEDEDLVEDLDVDDEEEQESY